MPLTSAYYAPARSARLRGCEGEGSLGKWGHATKLESGMRVHYNDAYFRWMLIDRDGWFGVWAAMVLAVHAGSAMLSS